MMIASSVNGVKIEGIRSRSGFWLLLTLTCMCVASICSVRSALARGSVDDAAATRVYLRAREVFERSLHVELRASVAAIEGRAMQIAAECQSALTYAPRDMAFSELDEEVSSAVIWAWVAPVRSPTLALARTIGHLRWTSRKLTRFVRALALEERGVARVVFPDVCADIAAWKASAYSELPLSTSRFLAGVEAIEAPSNGGPPEEPSEAAIMRLLRPYEDPAEGIIAKRVERLEAVIGKRMYAADTAATVRLASALGVSAL